MKRIFKIQLLIFFVLLFLFQYITQALGIQSTTHERLREHVRFLASDELKGRYPGTPEFKLAEDYIVREFQKAGPKYFMDSYLQTFNVVTGMEIFSKDSNQVIVTTTVQRPGIPKERLPRVSQPWIVTEDFMPLAFTKNASAKGEVVFVGFGITAPELNYDDYKDIDVSGRIVVLLNETPDGEVADTPFDKYRSLRYKMSNAKSRGAIGVIMVRIQGDSMNVFERLNYENLGSNADIVAVQAWRQTLSRIFPREYQLQMLENTIMKEKKPMSIIIPNTEIFIQTKLKPVNSPSSNIVGFVRGTDPQLAEQYVVIGAHYDHLGYGGPTSAHRGKRQQIHNGADDNASGVAGIIELAHYFTQNPPKRSLIFVAFTAEETGLHGSRWFVQHPFVGMENIVGMINLDMIGRLRQQELTIFGTRTSPVFADIINKLESESNFKIIRASEAYSPSDHAPFLSAEKPVMMFFTGLHEDYHKPTDTWNKINYDGMVTVVDFIARVVTEITNYPKHLEFTPVTVHESPPPQSRGYADVWFGIIPDFEDSPLGCKISGASPGSPAAEAGLLKDDIITHIEGTKISNLHDFMYKIREFKPGDVLKVKILRGADKTPMEFDVRLVAKSR